MTDSWLVLDDGFTLPGLSFGAPAPTLDEIETRCAAEAPKAIGEVVFVTAMSGYHELVTDPSYTGQVVTLTYPHAGNYGCDDAWSEAGGGGAEVSPAGLVCRSLYTGPVPDGRLTLDRYLAGHATPGITNVDTRRLALHLRDNGARNGLIVATESAGAVLAESERERVRGILASFPSMEGRNLVTGVGNAPTVEINPEGSPHLVLLNCGAKQNIVRLLAAAGCRLTMLPASADGAAVRAAGADALFVSNGPGDPAVLDAQISLIRETIGRIPVFGICLGHQLIARALGAATFKMPFGHHGLNHPVRDRRSGRVFVTSQNHGFAVHADTLPQGCEIWFDNANDGTVEGLADDGRRVLSTQFHPEAAPGPHDAHWIFGTFLEMAGAEQGGH